MKKNSFIKLSVAALLVSSFAVQNVLAIAPEMQPVPFLSYTYGVWDASVPTSPAYEPTGSVTGNDLGIGAGKLFGHRHRFAFFVIDAGHPTRGVEPEDRHLA